MKTKKILAFAIVVVLLAGVGLSIGLTYSIWSDTSGGDTSVAPSITTYDWNYYTKYFTYTAYNENGEILKTNVRNGDTITNLSGSISYFACTGLTNNTLLENVIFPTSVTYIIGNTSYSAPLREIGSTIFDDITYKSIPTYIAISPSISKIRADAFAGLTNLNKIVICGRKSSDPPGVSFGLHALGNCAALKEIVCEGESSIRFTDLSGIGCSSLTTINKGSCSLVYITNIDNGETTAITSSNWATYKAKIFQGAPNDLNPFA